MTSKKHPENIPSKEQLLKQMIHECSVLEFYLERTLVEPKVGSDVENKLSEFNERWELYKQLALVNTKGEF